jgi:aminobenzoyl-glutamate transport protein
MSSQSIPLRILNHIEVVGNRLPHPTLLFIILAGLVLLISALASMAGLSVIHPQTNESIAVVNLLSAEGIQRILTNTVQNFTSFAPVGTVLVAMLGLGVAERSGLIGLLLQRSVSKARGHFLTFSVVFAGVMSSLAADAGYVVLIPLAALIFQAAGRHPLAGIAAAFAGVSGGYSANLLLGPFDAILSGISTEAAQLVSPGYDVSIAANYYFMVASAFLIAAVASVVTARWVEPRLRLISVSGVGDGTESDLKDSTEDNISESTINNRKGLRAVGLFSLVFVSLILLGLLPEDGFLRGSGSIIGSPFMKGIVVVIALYALITGWIFARFSRRWESNRELVTAMESSMAGMAGYIVLMFFAAQFVAYFSWSQLGLITAIEGAELLTRLELPPVILLIAFILVAATINLLVGSGSAKWALLAPVFVPMLMLTGIAPESTQVAFRIGDSVTNIVTPLMPYFGVVLAFAQKYRSDLGMGTMMAMMLPYSIGLLLMWSVLLAFWIGVGLPLGF